MKAELYIQAGNSLGEGPLWDFATNNLLWVDIEKKLLCISDVRKKNLIEVDFKSRLSAVALTNKSNLVLLALETGLELFDLKNGESVEIANPERNIENNRFNDGKCDPVGRFWIGSMDRTVKPEAGSLYCLEGFNAPQRKLKHLTISNGMDWNLDKKQMYFIDTADYEVKCFDYKVETGSICNPRKVITVPEGYGAPDGMCIDAEGMLWIAHWAGGNVSRWNPENGKLLETVIVPAPHVTSCCFGGENLDTLFITTARKGLNAQQLKDNPQSGGIFFVQPGVKGLRTNLFQIHLNKKLNGNY